MPQLMRLVCAFMAIAVGGNTGGITLVSLRLGTYWSRLLCLVDRVFP